MAELEAIDCHQHFWRYSASEYGWIGEGMDVLRRDFLPSDLAPVAKATGIGGTVAVQARQTMEETEWLLSLTAENPLIRGVVGWAPLISERAEESIERLAANSHLKGLRHVLHDEPDDNYMLRPDFLRGVGLLERRNLVYDILIFERHLPQTLEFVDRFPGQTFVVDHVAKPRIREGVMEPWRTRMIELARRPNVYCKISGMVTEADWKKWRVEHLRPYFETVVEAFGPRRVMFGSDWPVVLLGSEYSLWADTVRSLAAKLSAEERDALFRGTAASVYKL
jgi:L-fuconolactonase